MTTQKYEREQFGLKTKSMPLDVYKHLDKKAKKRELLEYIIELVEKDLKKSHVASEVASEMDKLRQDIAAEFAKMNDRLSNLSVVSSDQVRLQERELSVVEDITEGQLIEEDVRIQGSIAEEYETDF